VGLLCVVACLNYLDRVMLTTMRGSVVAAVPMTDAQFGLMTSVFLWVYACLSPLAGFLADRYSRSKVIITGLLVWSLVTWLTAHATGFGQLLATRALMGISEACYIPAALSLIADYHRGPTRSFATGVHMVGISIGAGLGGLGGWIAERHAWTTPFRLFGAIGVAYSVVLLFTLRDAPADAEREDVVAAPKIRLGEALASLFRRGSFSLALAYWGLLGIAGWAVIGWLPTFFGEHFHLGQGEAGLSATGYLQPATWAGMLLGGLLADRWSRRSERGRIYVVVAALALAVPGILLGSHTNLFPLAVAGFMLHSAAYGATDSNMMPILCLVTDARYRATGYGVLNFFGCAMGGLTIYLGGVLRDAKIDDARIFEAAAGGMVICAFLLLMMRPKPEPRAGA